MIFTKVPYAANFLFAEGYDSASGVLTIPGGKYRLVVRHFEGDVHHLQVENANLWPEDRNLVALLPPAATGEEGSLRVGPQGQIAVLGSGEEVLLGPCLLGSFGVCGQQSVFAFDYDASMRLYGLGEKTYGQLEVSKRTSRFWNTDVLSDFHHCQWQEDPCDPYYVSVPYLIVRRGETYIGLLLHNPYPTWIDTGSDPSFFGTEDANRKIILGSEDGLPSLWVIVGPSLAELTSKLQKLVGTTPRPPIWALGYHQCRWGYRGEADLLALDQKFTQHRIPCDGLWLDIDYMEGYRVFSYEKKYFPNGVPAATKKLAEHGRRVVPILDPGVKLDPSFPVYQDGQKAGIYCQSPIGKPFVGFVWPGETVFPDFSLKEGRDWWSRYAKGFREAGFAGAWIDMNDPSTGTVDPESMLFHRGAWSHGAFRNQYALGMQMATREGFCAAFPKERPFVLSRSGYTGTSRFAAIWTGDNLANRWYLKGSIPTSIGLSLSGIPFNGPDIGGFMNDTNPALMMDWMKAGFLFPFCRNHSGANTRPQEPWALGADALRVLRHYIRLRYKLLPYLYQVFIEQEREGHSILRPVQYHFSGGEMPDDQFLVGGDVLQAPCLVEGEGRTVKLPGKARWFDARTGEWVKGTQRVESHPDETPLYFRSGAVVPTLVGERTTNEKDLSAIEAHLFVEPGHHADGRYLFDDGLTTSYQDGAESEVHFSASLSVNGTLRVDARQVREGAGKGTVTGVAYGNIKRVLVNGRAVRTRKVKVRWTGREGIPTVQFAVELASAGA